MSYESVEASLASLLKRISNLEVALNDGTRIPTGKQKLAILKYGGFTQERHSGGGEHKLTWSIEIQVMCRYTTDINTRNLLRDTRMDILNQVNKYPLLNANATVFDAFITEGTPGDEQVQIGSISYLTEMLTCRVEELISVTYLE